MNMHMPGQGFRKPTHEVGWTEERVELLRKLCAEGKSFREIATALGGGVSRSSCIGKARRLKLPSNGRQRTTPVAAKPVTGKGGRKGAPGHRKVFHQPGVPKFPQISVPRLDDEPGPQAVLLEALDAHTCKWPVGSATGEHQQFCGREPVEGKPYCAGHAARGYERPEAWVR